MYIQEQQCLQWKKLERLLLCWGLQIPYSWNSEKYENWIVIYQKVFLVKAGPYSLLNRFYLFDLRKVIGKDCHKLIILYGNKQPGIPTRCGMPMREEWKESLVLSIMSQTRPKSEPKHHLFSCVSHISDKSEYCTTSLSMSSIML